jgi:hypothetical protein
MQPVVPCAGAPSIYRRYTLCAITAITAGVLTRHRKADHMGANRLAIPVRILVVDA